VQLQLQLWHLSRRGFILDLSKSPLLGLNLHILGLGSKTIFYIFSPHEGFLNHLCGAQPHFHRSAASVAISFILHAKT